MKEKVIMFIVVVSLLFNISMVYSAPDEGYGENNTALGQFTDTFINDGYIDVLDSVIVNATLECVELNYTAGSGGYENLNDYTEVDIGADRITVQNNTWVEHLARRNEDTYLYYDYGVNYFDDFTHDFDFEGSFDVAGCLGHPYLLTQTVVNDVFTVFTTANEKSIHVRLYRHSTQGNQFIFYYFSGGSVVGDSDLWQGPTSDTIYYIRIVKDDASAWLGVYSTSILRDAGDGTDGDVTNLSLSLGSDLKFRYIFSVNTWNDGAGNYDINYDVHKLTIGWTAGAYQTSGYFITDDYLNHTTGNTLALLTSTQIPNGTSITVQFSDDKSTWVDNEGNVGSTTILDGLYAIDLRNLNYTDSYKMFNLSGTTLLTPRLNQSRLITTMGVGGGDGISSIFLIPIFAIVGLICLIAILLRGRK